jgi:2-iminobutanoate/2-iminopropanoate deaminase
MVSDRVRARAGVAAVVGLVLGIAVGGIVSGVSAEQSVQARRRVIHPEKSPNTGLPYSPGIMVGSTLYISGHLGRDPVSAKLVSGGIEAETRQSLANIREVLRAAGMDFGDVASVTVYIASFEEFARFNAVYREFFAKDPPAREWSCR